MKNILFIDREEELAAVARLAKRNFFLVVRGRRRIGKTSFLRKCFPDGAYIFIWPNKSLDWIVQRVCEENALPSFRSFADMIAYLLDRKNVVIIDEFQNLLGIDRSVYGEMQRLIDERKGGFMKLAVAGSGHSLISKVFGDAASPLYGRRTAEITLGNLPMGALFRASGASMENFIKLWSVFEGVPYYYELIDASKPAEDVIADVLLSRNAILQDEGRAVLSVEFGQDSKTYNTALAAIAEGKTKLNEISGMFGNRRGETVKYLDILRNEFRLVKRVTPALSDPRKSKEGRYALSDNFLGFWFRFIDRQRDLIEQGRFSEVEDIFRKDFPSFVGKRFEKFVLEMINTGLLLPDTGHAAAHWGSVPGKAKDKDQYEIDLLGIKKGAVVLIGECKWQDSVDAEEEAKKLDEKASYVSAPGAGSAPLAIFAKSFKRRSASINGRRVLCFDLSDLSKVLKRT